MEENRYTISDAANMTELETHVLRYWEDELKLSIPRNEMGHRYYMNEHIDVFKQIKEYRDMGYQLKTIRLLIDKDKEITGAVIDLKQSAPQPANDKMQQFEEIIGNIVTKVLRDNNIILSDEIGDRVSDKLVKELDYHMRVREELEEERYKKLDETIRNCQKEQREKKKKLWKKR